MFSEQLRAVPVFPGDPALHAVVHETEPFYAGGTATKYLLTGELPDGQPASFVERPYNQQLVENYVALREAGLPVAPTMHHDTDHNALILPDLKAAGGELYGKSLARALGDDDRYRESPQADAQFQKMMERRWARPGIAQITKAAGAVATKATRANITLPEDDPLDLLVHPDGSWQVMALDIEFAIVATPGRTPKWGTIRDHNRECVEDFLSSLHSIQRQL